MTKEDVIKQLEEKCKEIRKDIDILTDNKFLWLRNSLYYNDLDAHTKIKERELELFQEILILLKLKEE